MNKLRIGRIFGSGCGALTAIVIVVALALVCNGD